MFWPDATPEPLSKQSLCITPAMPAAQASFTTCRFTVTELIFARQFSSECQIEPFHSPSSPITSALHIFQFYGQPSMVQLSACQCVFLELRNDRAPSSLMFTMIVMFSKVINVVPQFISLAFRFKYEVFHIPCRAQEQPLPKPNQLL